MSRLGECICGYEYPVACLADGSEPEPRLDDIIICAKCTRLGEWDGKTFTPMSDPSERFEKLNDVEKDDLVRAIVMTAHAAGIPPEQVLATFPDREGE